MGHPMDSVATNLRKGAMVCLRNTIAIIREHKKAFVTFNLAFYGVVALSMLATAFYPELQEQTLKAVDEDLKGSAVGDAYGSGNLIPAIWLTFSINLGMAAILTMTLPSLIIPFAGILMILVRAVLWGVLFSPISPDAATLIPHSLTIIIEGQAYILTAFSSYVHGRTFIGPGLYGFDSRWAGYKAGLVKTAWLYVLIMTAIMVGAIYEGIEVIYLMPLLR